MNAMSAFLDAALREHEYENVDAALELYGRALDALPDYAHPVNRPGDAAFDRPQAFAEASLLDSVIDRLEFEGSHADHAQILRAGFQRLAGDPAAALETGLEALKGEGASVQSVVTIGLTYLDLHQFDESLRVLSKGVAQFPEDASLRNHLGAAQREASQFAAAVESFRMAGALGLALGQANYAAMLRESGNAREAINVYRGLLAEKPGFPKAAHNLCVALMSLGEDAAAVEAGKQAVASDPDFDDYNCYGNALLANDEYAAALSAFETSLSMNPRGITALAMTAGALAGVGRDDDVRTLIDFGRFLLPLSVRAPAEYADLAAFNNAIYDYAIDFPDQPGNTRQTLDLAEHPHGPLALLKDIIEGGVQQYINQLSDDPTHPFTAYKPKKWDLHIWATREKSLPYQFPHIHPHGWISGIYYPRIPAFQAPKGDPEAEFPGHVEFFRFLQFSNRPVVSESLRIPAEEGLMVLFPSYFHHGINPFESDAPRMSIAFNAMPRD